MRALYDALNAEFGTWELAPGYTTTGARVLNFVEGLGNKAFQKGLIKVRDSLPDNFGGGAVDMQYFRSDGDYIGNNWKENPNGEGYYQLLRAGSPDIQERAASLRARVEAVNDDFIKRYGWGGVKRSLPRSDAAGSGRDRSVLEQEARPSYGTAREGSVRAVGIHYSNQERSSLSGTHYGTGLDGAERARVMASDDARLRERIYFYASTGTGVLPETGVGGYPHSVNLNNLYDVENDPLRLYRAGDTNASESAIIDAGFDGYIAPFGNSQKAVVLLGKHTVDVKQEEVGYRGQDTTPATTAKPNDTLVLQRAIQANRSLPGGQMTGADWKRMMPRLMPEVDVSHLDDNKTYYKDGLVKRSVPRFYSPLARAFDKARQDTMPAKQWALWLASNKAQQGLKDDEIEFSGILNYLELRGKDKVTKAEIADYLAGNGVVVNTVEKREGGKIKLNSSEEDDVYAETSLEMYGRRVGELSQEEYETLAEVASLRVRAENERLRTGSNGPTKFSGYWDSSYKGGIPGTYRETLVTLPAKAKPRAFGDWQKEMDAKYGVRSNLLMTTEEMAEGNRLRNNYDSDNNDFKGGHWDESNVLAHIRTDEVLGSDGKRYLRVGEIQSDFGQSYKKQKDAVRKSVDSDFQGIVKRMKDAGVLEVICD
jgi:hypothetical protein